MNSPVHRTCHHCRQRFVPDYRNAYHQRFCSQAACQRASKRASQRHWLRKPKNCNYFREVDNVLRVHDWRREHPGYWRSRQHRCAAGLPTGPERVLAPSCGSAGAFVQPRTLQDVCRSKLPIFTGILSRLSSCTLQEDIANCAQQMVSEAQCILLQCHSSFSRPAQASGAVNHHESG
jgi:hypothetical protein